MIIEKSEQLINEMKSFDEVELDDMFFGNPPGINNFHSTLTKILDNIIEVKKYQQKVGLMTKEERKNREKQLLELTGAFCAQKLDDDYYQLCERLILKLGRKRDVPLKKERAEGRDIEFTTQPE